MLRTKAVILKHILWDAARGFGQAGWQRVYRASGFAWCRCGVVMHSDAARVTLWLECTAQSLMLHSFTFCFFIFNMLHFFDIF